MPIWYNRIIGIQEDYMQTNEQKESLYSTLSLFVVVTLLYLVSGYLGLLVATPPGYATAIWIPSGIALGAALVWGLRIVPAVFVGSLLTNFFTSLYSASYESYSLPLLISMLIACGASLQVIFGWYLIRRYLGSENLLIKPTDILKFIVLSGPISCLVNTTWSNAALLSLGIITSSGYLLNWFTWWIGDAMGVIIFTPFFLILFAKPNEVWRQRIIPIIIPLLMSFFAVVTVCYFVHASELQRIQADFSQSLGNSIIQISNAVNRRSNETVLNKRKTYSIINTNFDKRERYYQIRILDITNLDDIREVYSWSNPLAKPPHGKYLFINQNIFEIGDKKWLVSAIPSMSFINHLYSWHLGFVLISGLLFCSLINIVLFILFGQKTLAQYGMAENINALKKAEATNLQILRAAGEGIYGIDKNGNTTFVNPAGAAMLGYEESEIIGKRMHELIHHSHPDGSLYFHTQCPIYNSFRHNQVQHVTNEVFWRKDGSSFWVEYTSTPMRDGANTIGAVVIFDDVTDRKEIESELHKMAHFDPLTSLPNRASFFQKLALLLDDAKQDDQLLAICFIDLDDFKHINDTLGHDVGDEVLKEIAGLLRPVLRDSDSIARIGGDEFAVILSKVRNVQDIQMILNRFFQKLQKPIKLSHGEVRVSMSIGVAIYPSGGKSATELVKNADIAMYHAKEFGKGSYAFYDEQLNTQIKRRHQLDQQLQHAVENRELFIEYQPQIQVKNMQPTGIEALLRWNNKEFGQISPSEFIIIAERNGLINSIGEWVLRNACKDYHKISKALGKEFSLAVNVSVIQLENPSFLSILDTILKETNMPPNQLTLEITETALIKHPQRIIKVMNEIKKHNVKFALDDFGVSYSSMQYLKNLPISCLKIDHNFVKDLSSNVSDIEIVNATIKLAHGMGISTVAEGVETNEQFLILKELNCDYMQGFLFARPMQLGPLIEAIHSLVK